MNSIKSINYFIKKRRYKTLNKDKIIQEALKRIGTTNINLLDGMTLVIDNIWYNIYVKNENVTIDIID